MNELKRTEQSRKQWENKNSIDLVTCYNNQGQAYMVALPVSNERVQLAQKLNDAQKREHEKNMQIIRRQKSHSKVFTMGDAIKKKGWC